MEQGHVFSPGGEEPEEVSEEEDPDQLVMTEEEQ